MKRNATLVGLAAALAVAAGLAFYDRARPTTDEAAHTRARIIPDFARAQATRLELVRRDGRTIALQHEASGWWLDAPRRRADDDAVESLLAVLEFGQVERRLGDGDVHALGLAPPLVTLRAAGHVLRIGADTPDRGVYLLRDDARDVLVAEHRLVEVADLDPALWRSPHLTLRDPASATRLGFGEWTLVRDRGWRVIAPVIVRASDEKVDALIQSLTRARAMSDAPPTTANAAPTGVALTIDGEAEARVEGPCPGLANATRVLRADGAALCFATTDLDTLRAPLPRLYQRRLFPQRLDDVNALDVTAEGKILSLRRESGVWRVIAPRRDAGPASDERVRAIVRGLLDAEGRLADTVDSEPPRARSPDARHVQVRLAGATADTSVDFTFDGGIAFARRAGETISFEIDPARVATLRALTPAELRVSDGGAY